MCIKIHKAAFRNLLCPPLFSCSLWYMNPYKFVPCVRSVYLYIHMLLYWPRYHHCRKPPSWFSFTIILIIMSVLSKCVINWSILVFLVIMLIIAMISFAIWRLCSYPIVATAVTTRRDLLHRIPVAISHHPNLPSIHFNITLFSQYSHWHMEFRYLMI